MTIERQHIVGLSISNVKRIEAVSLKLDHAAGTVIISGPNGAGKSSILDSIMMAVRGKGAIPDMPIRDGQEKASIEVTTEDLVIKRRITEHDSYLEVTSRDGASRFSKPQELMDKLVATVGFDPLRFSQMDKKEQAVELLRICKSGFSIADHAARVKKAEEIRREANSERERCKRVFESKPTPEDHWPTTEIDAMALLQEMGRAQAAMNEHEALVRQTATWTEQIQAIDAEIDGLQARRAKLAESIMAREEAIRAAPNHAEIVAGIKIRVEGAADHNRRHQIKREFNAAGSALAAASRAADAEQRNVEAIRAERAKAIVEAKIPVPGLTIDDDGTVLLNAIPLSQCSTSEQIRVGVALASAADPGLRVIFIKDGSLLDAASMRAIESLAAENDLQVWMERVEDKSPAAIQICEGRVV